MSWTSTKKLAAHYLANRTGEGMVPPFFVEPICPADPDAGWRVRNATAPSINAGALSLKFAADLAAAMNEVCQ